MGKSQSDPLVVARTTLTGETVAQKPQDEMVTAEMADEAAMAQSAALQARIGELEAENDALRHRPEAADAAASTGRGRNAGAIALVIVAALVLALAVPAVWMNRMLTDTDVYVATVAPLAQNRDIQNAVAAAASEAVIEKVDAKTRIQQVLPENLQIIATPVAHAVNDFITKESLTLARSDKFAQVWETVNRASHKALVTAVTGRDTGAIGVEAGVITLDVGTIVSELRSRLTGAGLEFVSGLPTANINKTIVLHESPVLARLTTTVDLVSRIAYWLPILGLTIAVGAIALAADRRKAVLWLGGALAIAALLPLQVIYFSQTLVVNQLYQLASIPEPAAQAAYEIVFRDLVTADRAAIALGIVIWIGAMVVGPARWAAALRMGLSGGLSQPDSTAGPSDSDAEEVTA